MALIRLPDGADDIPRLELPDDCGIEAGESWGVLGRDAFKHMEGVVESEDVARVVLARLGRRREPWLGFDTETTGWDPRAGISPYGAARAIIFSLSDEDEAWAFDGRLLGVFRPLFERGDVHWLGVNLKFDSAVLWNHGIDLRGRLVDARVLSRMRNPVELMRHGLKQMSQHFLGRGMTEFKDVLRIGSRIASTDEMLAMDPLRFAAYARDDVVVPHLLVRRLRTDLEAMPWHGPKTMWDMFVEYEEPFTHVLIGMERRGILIDQERRKEIVRRVEAEAERLQDAFEAIVKGPINLNSDRQVEHLFYRKLKCEPTRWTNVRRCAPCDKLATKATGGVCRIHGDAFLEKVPSMNKWALEDLMAQGVHEAEMLFRWRKVSKLASTHLPAMGKAGPDGRVRTTFVQYGADSGRISSQSPPMQVIPRPDNDDPDNPDELRRGFALRSLIIAQEGMDLVCADESQVELRLMAHNSGDPTMLRVYRDGGDLHSEAAKALFGLECRVEDVERLHKKDRSTGKTINFAIQYGAGWPRVAAAAKVSRAKAEEMLDGYYARFPGVAAYKRDVEARCRHHGFVRTVLGRYHHSPFIRRVATSPKMSARYWDDRDMRSKYQAELRKNINVGCQGGAMDVLQTAMLIADGRPVAWHPLRHDTRLLDMGAAMVLTVHDELLFEVPKEAADEACRVVAQVMSDPLPRIKVPLIAEAHHGPTWLEAKG